MTDGAKWRKLLATYEKAYHECVDKFFEDEEGRYNITEKIERACLDTFYDLLYEHYEKKVRKDLRKVSIGD